MTDIVSARRDVGIFDTQAPRAGNILSVQLGSLEYAPDLGIDLAYFLSDTFQFQNESFKAYLIERLANSGINVSSVTELLENLYAKYTFGLVSDQSNSGLIAR